MKQYFALGAYTEPILFGTGEVYQGKGRGITVCTFDEGKIEIVTEIPVRNPSFLYIDEIKHKIYAVNEMKEYLSEEGGGLTQLSYTDDFTMTIEDTWNAGGKDPCHLEAAPGGEFIAISNFASGSVTTFPLDKNGNVIGSGRKVFQHKGSSVHPVRQTGPHAHSCIFSAENNLLFVPDLGIDSVVSYKIDGAEISPDESGSITVNAGSGPRYGEFSSDGAHFYLINEISSRVIHYSCDNGRLNFKQEVKTLPDDFTGDNICSDLHITPDGTRLYASNRGHDSIVSFEIGNNGDLSLIDRTPCGGKTPRNFSVDLTGKHLLVGNQDSNLITVFRIAADGKLDKISDWETGSPVCIKFFKS